MDVFSKISSIFKTVAVPWLLHVESNLVDVAATSFLTTSTDAFTALMPARFLSVFP